MGRGLSGGLAVAFLVACGGQDRVQQNVGPTKPSVAITPTAVTLAPQAQQQFNATTTGTSEAPTWTVVESAGGGTISTGGLYTAPASEGVYHVAASLPSSSS